MGAILLPCLRNGHRSWTWGPRSLGSTPRETRQRRSPRRYAAIPALSTDGCGRYWLRGRSPLLLATRPNRREKRQDRQRLTGGPGPGNGSEGILPGRGQGMANHSNYLTATLIVDMEQPPPEVRATSLNGVVSFDSGLCGHFSVQSQDPAALARVAQAFAIAADELAERQAEAKVTA